MKNYLTILIAIFIFLNLCDCNSNQHLAQLYRGDSIVFPLSDGSIICEGEEFKVEKGNWEIRDWGDNYFCATFAITFLSRKSFISLPESCEDSIASIRVKIEEDGKYLVLCRYERLYRFNTIFIIQIIQNGKLKFNRVYGRFDNIKIWPFYRLQKEVVFDWGAVENIVWEGHDAYVDLEKGECKILLIGGKQPEPAGKRNIDVILLTKDEEQVKKRIERESYLPLDGWLTQLDDVWIKVENKDTKEGIINVSFQEHSPYWVHMRNYKPVNFKVGAGDKTDWIEIGRFMDALNDGQLKIISKNANCKAEIGIRSANGKIESIRNFFLEADKVMIFNAPANLRYVREIKTIDEEKENLLNFVKNIKPKGKKPEKTLIYANTFDEFREIYGFRDQTEIAILHGKNKKQIEEWILKLSDEEKRKIKIISLGDEISLPSPDKKEANEKFVEYLKNQGIDLQELNKTSWEEVKYSISQDDMKRDPKIYYWSKKFTNDYGINKIKELTDILRKHFKEVGIGANFSPHHGGYKYSYLGETHKWIRCFRKEALTMPWAEDYIWQIPVGSPQMNGINLDLLRGGIIDKNWMKIHYYVMPHSPGNTPNMWKRLFYQSLAHGMKIINLFDFLPLYFAYTENYVNDYKMYETVLTTLYEYGNFEDIVQDGNVKKGNIGLLFSETGDIWDNNSGSFASGKRSLYILLKNQQFPVDFITEEDILNERIFDKNIIFITERNISKEVAKKLDKYVEEGGVIFLTCGAGKYDEYNNENLEMEKLTGLKQIEIIEPTESQVYYIKQDLPWAKPITYINEINNNKVKIPVFGAICRVKILDTKNVKEYGLFEDGLPAITIRKHGKGLVVYCGFLPGLSYFYPAIPKLPVDRGNKDTSFSHFIPFEFDRKIGEIVRSFYNGDFYVYVRDEKGNDAGFVETGIIESNFGKVIIFINWSNKNDLNIQVEINENLNGKKLFLSSGDEINQIKYDKNKTLLNLKIELANALIIRK